MSKQDLNDLRIQLARNEEPEEDYPHQRDEIRRDIVVQAAMDAADAILMEGSNGSEEETDWLTSEVALRWAQKAHCAAQRRLLKKELLG